MAMELDMDKPEVHEKKEYVHRRRHSSFDIVHNPLKKDGSKARVRRSSVGNTRKSAANGEPTVHNRVFEALKLFKMFDLDEDGVISQEDFMQTMKKMSDGTIDERKIRSTFKSLCQNSETISRGAFIDVLHLLYEDPPDSDDEDDNDNSNDDDDTDDDSDFYSSDDDDNLLPRDKRPVNKVISSPGRLTRGRLWAVHGLINDSNAKDPSSDELTYSRGHTRNLASSLFQLLDVENDGAISLESFKQSWMDIDPNGQEEAFENLFYEMDHLKTGVVTEEEFVGYFSLLSSSTIQQVSSALDSVTAKRDSSTDTNVAEPQEDESLESFDPVLPRRRASIQEFSTNPESDNMRLYSGSKITRDLCDTLRKKDADVHRLEREIQRNKILSNKIDHKYKRIQQDVNQLVEQKKNMQSSRIKLLKHVNVVKEEAKKTTAKAEAYESLNQALKDKVAKLESQLKNAKQDQLVVKSTLLDKQQLLTKTQYAHEQLRDKHKHLKKTDLAREDKMHHKIVEAEKMRKRDREEIKKLKEQLDLAEKSKLDRFTKNRQKIDDLEKLVQKHKQDAADAKKVSDLATANDSDPLPQKKTKLEHIPSVVIQQIAVDPDPEPETNTGPSQNLQDAIPSDEDFDDTENENDDVPEIKDDVPDNQQQFVKKESYTYQLESETTMYWGMDNLLDKSRRILNHWMKKNDQETKNLKFLLSRCKGIVISNLLKMGLIIGGLGGSGIVMSRSNNKWSGPLAVQIRGVSLGGVLGASVSDTILVLTSDSAIEAFSSGSVKVGGNLQVQAGNTQGVDLQAHVASGASGLSSAYGFSFSKGMFISLSIEGSYFSAQDVINEEFYGKKKSAKEILSKTNDLPDSEVHTSLLEMLSFLERDIPIWERPSEEQNVSSNSSNQFNVGDYVLVFVGQGKENRNGQIRRCQPNGDYLVKFFDYDKNRKKDKRRGYFPSHLLKHNKFFVNDRIVFYDGYSKYFGVIKRDEPTGRYPVAKITNDGHGEKQSKDEYFIPAPYLLHAKAEKMPLQSKHIHVTMITGIDRTALCDKVFTVACGQNTSVANVKKFILKIVEKKSSKNLSLVPKDFKIIRLLRLEDVELASQHGQKMQKMLDDRTLAWNSFSEGRGTITVILTGTSSISTTTTTTTTTTT